MKGTFYKDEEQELVYQSLNGNVQAQKSLYLKYAQAMYNVVLRMTADPSTSKDIVQDSFIKVFSKLNHFKGDSSLGAWIKRITINTTLDQLRIKAKYRMVSMDNIEENMLEEDSKPNISYQVRQIHQAIKLLPEKCRVVFNLYQMEGYNHAEIAAWLDISESTSKSQYIRAKKLLKEHLKSCMHE